MKKLLSLSILLLVVSLISFGQSSSNSRTWYDMMLDPATSFFETQKAFYDFWEGKTPEKGMGYSVFKRWEYYWSSRIDDNGNFLRSTEIDKKYNQFVEEYANNSRFKSSAPVWKELGPRNRNTKLGYMGIGRVNAIAFHPTDTATVYLGAPAGGFWITNDSGQNWVTHTDNSVTMGVSAIAVHPDNPEKILIGTI